MNFLHAAYGIFFRIQISLKPEAYHFHKGFGALSAPLIATQFADFSNWTLYYCSSLGLSVFTFAILALVFKFQTQEGQWLRSKYLHIDNLFFPVLLVKNGYPPNENVAHASQHSTMRQIMGLKAVHTMAFYLLVYVGVEVTLGGKHPAIHRNKYLMLVLIQVGSLHISSINAEVDPVLDIFLLVSSVVGVKLSQPHKKSYFYQGLTLGRMLLHYVSRIIPDKYAVYIYAGLCLAFVSLPAN